MYEMDLSRLGVNLSLNSCLRRRPRTDQLLFSEVGEVYLKKKNSFQEATQSQTIKAMDTIGELLVCGGRGAGKQASRERLRPIPAAGVWSDRAPVTWRSAAT